jgi:uncharacterized radical SAM superfamily Fe-S cluster-containing enzyme
MYRTVLNTVGTDVILQLSGGEPTMREDLPAIAEMGGALGFGFIQLNTNGLRLAGEAGYAASLSSSGVSSCFLQFDGTEDTIYTVLRGRRLFREKIAAIENCAGNGIGVVLVVTLVPGVNWHNVGAILKLALEYSPSVRGVHFQPVGYFGRYPTPPDNRRRLTLPDVMYAIEEQTEGLMRVEDFTPPGWENSLCSFHGNFLPRPDGTLQPLSGHGAGCCCDGGGSGGAISFTARQWSAPAVADDSPPTGEVAAGGFENLDAFLARAKRRILSVSCMAFQDAWNLDLERARDCCIHVVRPDGRMIPFCLFNLTSADGRRLYR